MAATGRYPVGWYYTFGGTYGKRQRPTDRKTGMDRATAKHLGLPEWPTRPKGRPNKEK